MSPENNPSVVPHLQPTNDRGVLQSVKVQIAYLISLVLHSSGSGIIQSSFVLTDDCPNRFDSAFLFLSNGSSKDAPVSIVSVLACQLATVNLWFISQILRL